MLEARAELELIAGAQLEIERRQASRSVIGIVHPDGRLLRSIKKCGDRYVEVDEDPTLYLAEKIEPVLTRPKRLTVLIGGRSSGKSLAAGDIMAIEAKDDQRSALCLREYYSSITDSVHSLLKNEIERLELEGFSVNDTTIEHEGGARVRFNGLARNPDSVKSAFGFENMFVEEGQFLSNNSIHTLTPTVRNKPVNGLPSAPVEIEDGVDLSKVKILFVANPKSSADPFSQRFIVPFQNDLDRYGIYEDDLHLIIVINWQDNPWHYMSGVEGERLYDLKHKSKAEYDWLWGGKFNDEVNGSIIKVEWFDAAIDAHKLDRLKAAFKPQGARVVGFDPMDGGNDAHGYAQRHGSIIERVLCKDDGEIDVGMDWATNLALGNEADWFVWDGDGIGSGAKRQVSDAFNGTRCKFHLFKGSLSGSGQDRAGDTYIPVEGDKEQSKPATYADTFKNNRAQYYIRLAELFYNTYRCVVRGEYVDPADMISLDSEGIDEIERLRSEVCRIPLKQNNTSLKQIMSKLDMKGLGIVSPNMSDAIMMSIWGPKTKSSWSKINYPRQSIA